MNFENGIFQFIIKIFWNLSEIVLYDMNLLPRISILSINDFRNVCLLFQALDLCLYPYFLESSWHLIFFVFRGPVSCRLHECEELFRWFGVHWINPYRALRLKRYAVHFRFSDIFVVIILIFLSCLDLRNRCPSFLAMYKKFFEIRPRHMLIPFVDTLVFIAGRFRIPVVLFQRKSSQVKVFSCDVS